MKCKKCGRDTWVGVETSLCDECKSIKSEPPQIASETLTSEQIKQTVADIRERHELRVDAHKDGGRAVPYYEEDISELLRIVDEQSAEIERLTKERDEARTEAEKLRDSSERPGGGHTFLPWEKGQ